MEAKSSMIFSLGEKNHLKCIRRSLGQVSQLVGTSSPAQKGCRFNSQSGHVQETTNRCLSLSLSLSKINELSWGDDFFSLYFVHSGCGHTDFDFSKQKLH